jgi:geranylgeranyl diphosphate synthase type II
MMDAAALRRGMQTVHTKYGDNTALLTGDVMLIRAYEKLQTIHPAYLPKILSLFNTTAREVCEGQQLDMDFEKMPSVTLDAYIHMITLKTSVLLAASLEMGAILGGATPGNCKHLYEFGKNLGIAFQIQDDYLDAFGDPEKFGKEVGGDIRQNKKTFLLLHALEVATPDQRAKLDTLLASNGPEKVPQVMELFKACNVDAWAIELKEKYLQMALANLEDIAVTSTRKTALLSLANYLMQREN